MTPQEAIEWLEKAKGHSEALKMAKETLEKQVPKKPEETYDGYADGYPVIDYHCPTCGQYIDDEDGHGISDYCQDCGQHLDWSDVR